MSSTQVLPTDPGALIRSRPYRALLVISALIGLIVSAAAWLFLELVHLLQQWVYEDIPDGLGYDGTPWWWPLPWLALAGLLTALAIERLPGHGGHEPADGLKTGGGPTRPNEVPGVLLAAVATLGLGLVLGPEAPLIALGMGLGVLSMHVLRRDAPDQALGLMAAAGSFAAISTIFGSPVIGTVILIEATGLGGAVLPLVLLPGLLAAGIGSLVFIGLGSWSGLSTSAWSLSPFPLEPVGGPDLADFFWTIVIAAVVALVAFAIVLAARRVQRFVATRRFPLTIVMGLVVGALAIAFAQIADEPENAVLFSGEDAFGYLFDHKATLSVGTLLLLFLFKGLAWSVSLGSFRGGPTFPAIFLGAVAGFVVADLPGYGETQAVAALVGAMCVSVLRLPLSSVMIALLLTTAGGLGVSPIVIVAVVVAYLVTLGLDALAQTRAGAPTPAPEGPPGTEPAPA